MDLSVFGSISDDQPWPSDLSPQHLAMLKASGITPGVATARGYKTITTKSELEVLGFGQSQRSVPSLLVPIWTVDKEIGGYQARSDAPRMRNGKPVKYETPAGGKIRIDVPPTIHHLIGQSDSALWITEGSKKADAAASRGLCCVSLSGVWNWKSGVELADWDKIRIKGRKTYLAFDSDWHENPQVRDALVRLGAMLSRRGASVQYILIPTTDGRKVGLDDYLSGGGNVSGLLECATSEAPDKHRSNPLDTADYILTDLGNAERFATEHGQNLKWCAKFGKWLVWDGRRWKMDDSGGAIVIHLAGLTIRAMQRAALDIDDSEVRKKVVSWCLTSESVVRLKAMIELAKSTPGIAIAPEALDADRMILNVQNGTLELDTLQLREHRREDLLTRIASVPYTKSDSPQCSAWLKFLGRIHDMDRDKVSYIMKALGYSLIGDNRERCFFFCYGASGANGKSTMLSTVADILGEYARHTNPETFMDDFGAGKNSASPDVAALKEARFVVTSETSSGKKLNEELVKRITGNTDKIAARHLFQESFEFVPQFTIWMMGNHKPTIRGTDDAIWGRVVMIPFDVSIPPEERDKDLSKRLEAEHEGIFAWIIEGLRHYWDSGLDKPDCIDGVNKEYREEQDVLGDFLRIAIIHSSGSEVSSSKLYRAYERWARGSNLGVMSSKKFGLSMKERGVKGVRKTAGMFFVDVSMTADGVGLSEETGHSNVYRGGE